MNLHRIAFVDVDLPERGLVTIDAGSRNFDDWADEGLRRKRWTDGLGFVRDLLSERGRTPADASEDPDTMPLMLTPDDIPGLADEVLHAFAEGLVRSAMGFWRPRLERGARGKISKIAEADADAALASTPGETPADRLFRIVQRKLQDQKLAVDREAERIQAVTDPFESVMRHRRELEHLTSSHARLDELMGLSASRRLRDEVLGLTAVSSASERLLQRDNQVQDLIAGLNRQDALFKAAFGPLDEMREFGRHWDVIAQSLVQPNWARDIDQLLSLNLSRAALASIGDLASVGRGSSISEATASLLRPGWFYTAEAVLTGRGPRSAGAAVLTNYDIALPSDVLLAHALGDLHELDADETTPDDFWARLSQTIKYGLARWGHLTTAQRNATAGLLLLLIPAYSAALQTVEFLDKSHEREMSAATEAAHAELVKIRELLEQNRADARAARDDRSVSQKTNLRTDPDSRAQVIRLVFTDELIQVLEVDGDWAKVKVVDYRSDGATIGWLPQSRLRAP
ncbi:SH3 domain-containing protein [Brevundimonas sp. BR2-1]|uniref:SH3 domain-containing protein n=1 Tax=Brevundimonas sp. BR2-1 TaxID=3031123 RepID=UPI0030B471A8